MSYRDSLNRFPETNALRQLEVLEARIKDSFLRRQISKDTENASNNFRTELTKSKNELKDIKSKIKGFNGWAFFLGAATYHIFTIYAKKKLLYEMQQKALPHMGITLGVGIVTGFIFGRVFSYDYKLYRKFNKVQKSLDSIFEY
jgi:hypothetical protein